MLEAHYERVNVEKRALGEELSECQAILNSMEHPDRYSAIGKVFLAEFQVNLPLLKEGRVYDVLDARNDRLENTVKILKAKYAKAAGALRRSSIEHLPQQSPQTLAYSSPVRQGDGDTTMDTYYSSQPEIRSSPFFE